jgi:hypothetical protein
MVSGLELAPELTDLTPTGEIVVGVGALLQGNNLRQVAAEQRKGSLGPDDTDSHVVLVEHQDVAVQTGLTVTANHVVLPSTATSIIP